MCLCDGREECLCDGRKEEIFTEASKALKTLPGGEALKPSSSDDSGAQDPKKMKTCSALMPPFTEMIKYIQNKVSLSPSETWLNGTY
jgi:hypothetical protein